MNDTKDFRLRDLILRCRANDDDAFTELVELYTPMLQSVIHKLSRERDELFSEACLGLYKAAKSFDLEQSGVTFGLYARICVTRRLLDVIRRDSAAAESLSCDVDVEEIAVSDNIVSRLLSREESESLHSWARGLLSDYEYKVFRMWAHGDSAADISTELSTDTKSVENAKLRIKKKLRGAIGRRQQ